MKQLLLIVILVSTVLCSFSQTRKQREMKVDSLIQELASIDTVYLIAGKSQIDLYNAGSTSEDASILKGIVKYLSELKLSVVLMSRVVVNNNSTNEMSKVYFEYDLKERVFGVGPVHIPMTYNFITPSKRYQFNAKMFVYNVTDFSFESYDACKRNFFYEKGSTKKKQFQVKYF
jgi:hypothetical protein